MSEDSFPMFGAYRNVISGCWRYVDLLEALARNGEQSGAEHQEALKMGRAEDLFKRISGTGESAIHDLIRDHQSEELFLDFSLQGNLVQQTS